MTLTTEDRKVRMKIRVVDDDQSIIHLLTVLFQAEGLDPVITGSDFDRLFKPEAWEGIEGALVDGHLGAGTETGFDLLNYLKENHPHIKRVLFTGMDIEPSEVEGLVDVLLVKPARTDQIVNAFRG